MTEFSLTNSAAKRILKLAELENRPHIKLRIVVLGGGCSGFKYQFELTDEVELSDKQFEKDKAVVLVDKLSYEFIQNSVLDYSEDLGSAGFEIKNPDVTAKCGCGNSFAI